MSKYRDSMNRFRTFSLFKETNKFTDNYEAVFVLHEDDKDLPSLKRIYLSYEDPTEYQFALDVFDSWDHWERLTNCTFFKPYIKQWREELEVKIRSNAIKEIKQTAKTSKGFAAQKWLAEKGWQPNGKGRPRKEDVEREARVQAKMKAREEEDFKLVGLHEQKGTN